VFLEDLLTIFASRKMQKSQLENRIRKSQDCLKIDFKFNVQSELRRRFVNLEKSVFENNCC
jgi:hypothetical protein